jgi:hypothetical protein
MPSSIFEWACMKAQAGYARKQTLHCSRLVVLDDLEDGAGRAGVDAGAASDAGILVNDGSDLVFDLDDAHGAGIDARTAGSALIGVNIGT